MEPNNKEALIEYLIISRGYSVEYANELVNELDENGEYTEFLEDFLLEINIDGKNLYIWTDIDNLYAVEEEILLMYLRALPKSYDSFSSDIKEFLLNNIDNLIDSISFNKSIIKEWIEDCIYLGDNSLQSIELTTTNGFVYEEQ